MTDTMPQDTRPDAGPNAATAEIGQRGGRAAPAGHLPVSLLIEGRACLVVGAGHVGARKAASLARAGARVTVIAPEVGDEAEQLAERGQVVVERRAYRPGEAAGFAFVTTATGIDRVDALVSRDAQDANVWVNSADDPANCTVMLPAVHRDGPVTVAVSTGGASPALASWLRRRIAALCGDGLGTLAELLAEARADVHASGRSTESVDWQAILDGPLVGLVSEGRLGEARSLLAAAVDDPSAA